jgi:hypothetical protein
LADIIEYQKRHLPERVANLRRSLIGAICFNKGATDADELARMRMAIATCSMLLDDGLIHEAHEMIIGVMTCRAPNWLTVHGRI